jgi:hypothetical protein
LHQVSAGSPFIARGACARAGRRKPPPAGEPRPEHNLRLVLKDLDGHLAPGAATQWGSVRSQQSGRGEGPAKPPHQDIAAVLCDLDGARAEDAAAPFPGRRRLAGPEVARGRQVGPVFTCRANRTVQVWQQSQP